MKTPKEVLKVERTFGAFYTGGDVLLTSDGETLFCVSGSAVNVVDVSTGSVTKSFDLGEDDSVSAIALSPNDECLVIASKHDLLRHYEWRKSGEELQRNWRAMLKTPVVRLEFDVNNRLLASGSADGALKVWDMQSRYCTHNLKGCTGLFTLLRFHPTKHLLYGATGHGGTLFCWSLKDSALIGQFEAHTSVITDLRFFGKKYLTSSRDKVVVVWGADNQKIRSIPVYECVESLIPLRDGAESDKFATVGSRGVIRVWNTTTGACVKEQAEEHAAVLASETDTVVLKGSFNEAKKSFVVVTFEQNIVFFDEKLESTKRLIGNNDQVLDLALIGSDERMLAICTNSPLIRVFNLNSGHTSLLKGHTDIVLCTSVAKSYPDILVSGSKDNNIFIWSCKDGEMQSLAKGSGHTHSVGSAAFSKVRADQKGDIILATGGEDTTLKLWSFNVHSNALTCTSTVQAHTKDVMSIDISWNNQIVASGSQDKTVKLWNAKDLGVLGELRGHRRGIWCVKFSADEPILASASTDTTVRIWSIDELTCLRTFEGHDCSVLRVMFVSGSQQLLTAGADGNLKLWNMRTNDCAATFDGHEGRIWALTCSSDEMTFISGAADSAIKIWKDVTEEERNNEMEKREKLLIQEQTLLNLIQMKKWSKALKFALDLKHPQRTLNIVNTILEERDGTQELSQAIAKLKDYQEDTLISFCATWNTNSKHCFVAQTICRILLSRSKPTTLLEKIPNLKESCESLIPYTKRHHERLLTLQRQAMLFEYMMANLRIAND